MNFDVVIVGAGLIGLSLAKALDKAGFSCALVEQRCLSIELPQKYSNRVSAITHASQQWLKDIGAWENIEPFACAYQNMFVYDGEGTGFIDFKSTDVPCETLGSIVENSRIIDSLNNLSSNLETFEQCIVTSFSEVNEQGLRDVYLDNGQILSCQLIIGADSKQSTIRKIAKLDTKSWSYEQTAIVATITVNKPSNILDYSNKADKTCWQNFTYCGPLAFLPLYDLASQNKNTQSYSIVWSVDDDQWDEFSSKDLITQLKLHAPQNLGEILTVEDQAQFPLSALHCNQYTKAGLAIVGDAAHSIHPLAGQGANLGFTDAQKLFNVLVDAKKHDISLGNAVILKRYERERKLHNKIMQLTMEGFKRGFDGQNPIQVLLRNQAMSLTQHPLFPKAWVMNQALGK
ncbi:MAG: FAD-dependent monooxygenase [Saccharospirillaceae bacterium]|nr:FAD-dependent monooxygenase [Saccharospirillaceae bacterium]